MKIFRFILGFLVVISCVCGAFLYFVCKESDVKNCTITVNKCHNVPNLLVKAEISDNLPFTRIAVQVLSAFGLKVKLGEFLIPQRSSLLEAMRILNSGKNVIHKIIFHEGHTVAQFVEKIENNPHLQGTITEIPEEGSLMPDTYHFKYPTSRQQIIDLAKSTMDQFLEKEWPKRSENCLLKTPQEVLILASIVEKETPCEHVPVASVYTHRLKINMKLQADPTVIYAITKGLIPKNYVSFADLKVKSPYNTYTNFGLPPTPICCPSRKSILAVLHPEITNNLFFVYDPSISKHVYSADYRTHARHIARIKARMKSR